MKVSELIDELRKQTTMLRDAMYDDLDYVLGEKLPCDIKTNEGVLISKNKKITRPLLLRFIRHKNLLTEIEHIPLRNYLSPILEKYEDLDFYDVPFYTRKTQNL